MTKRARGGSNWWETEPEIEKQPNPNPSGMTAPEIARSYMPETAMPYNLQTVVFKRCAYLEDCVEQRRRDGKKFNFYQTELEGIVWLLANAGITYERQANQGMNDDQWGVAPEAPRPTAMAEALAKTADRSESARDFLVAACRVKARYPDEESARRVNEGQHPYACAICEGWHLTSLDPERSQLARRVDETRAPLPIHKQRVIVAGYRSGKSIDDLAAQFGFPRRAICNMLNDAGYSVSVARDEHRAKGIPG